MSNNAPRRVAFYISGHGFGHLAQTTPLLFALARLSPGWKPILRTDLPAALLRRILPELEFQHLPGQVDVGVVQHSAVDEDWVATRTAVETFFGPWEERIAEESARLTPFAPEAIVSNISPLAFPVARRLGIPSFALASIDWRAIYAPEWGEDDPWVTRIDQAHQDCDLCLSPPLSMPDLRFPRTESIPLLVRPKRCSRAEVRRQLGWKEGQKVALVLFGGTGQPPFDLQGLAHVKGWHFLLPEHLELGEVPPNVGQINIDAPLSTPDLLAGADVVVTKPAYGVLSEAWQANCPVVYLPREGFAEYPVLDHWLQHHAPAARLDLEAFRLGQWEQALEAAVQSSRRYPPLDASGGEAAAHAILRYLSGVG